MPTPFEDFPLHPAVLASLETLDVGAPTSLQAEVIPLMLEGRDLVVYAGPHSGETLAYGLPLLSMFDGLGKTQVVVLVPSAERAIRVYKKLAPLANGVLKIAPLYEAGGAQEQAVKRGVDVVIGTPFLVKDLFAIKQLDLNAVRLLILDGADRMMTTIQRRDVEYLLDRLPRLEQTALFTWSVTEGVEAIAHHLKDPAMVRATLPTPAAAPAAPPAPAKAAAPSAAAAPRTRKKIMPEPIETAPAAPVKAPAEADVHRYARVAAEQRADFLLNVLEREQPARAVVLARNKHEARRLALKLEKLGRAAVDNINADTSAAQRNTVLNRFRAGDLRFLVVPEQAAQTMDLGAPGHVYLTGVGAGLDVYSRYADACQAAGTGLCSLTLVAPETEAAFAALKPQLKFYRHPDDPGAPEEVPPILPPIDAPKRPRSRTGMLAAATPRSSATLLNDSQRDTKPSTGPLTPLPRMQNTWQTFKVAVDVSQRPSRDSFHGWLAQTTGIARSSLRSIQLHKGYATVDVDERQADLFQARLGEAILGPG